MEQKNTEAASVLQKKKTADNWLPILKLLTYLGMMLFSFSFATFEKNPVDSKPANVFPAISKQVIPDWNLAVLNEMEAPNYQHVFAASRLYAMVHIAQYNAPNSIKPVYKKYCGTTGDAPAHPVTAAIIAACTVLLHH